MRERYDAGGTQRTSSSILRGGAGLGVSVRGQRVRPSRIHPAFQCTHRRGRRREILDPCPAKLLHHRRRPRTQPTRRPRRLPVKRKCRFTVDHREAVALERVLSACSSTDMVFAKGQPVPMPAKPEVRPPEASGNSFDAPRLYDDNRNGLIPVDSCHTTERASRVATIPLFHACRRHNPGGAGLCAPRPLPDRWQPSPLFRRVGLRVARFEAAQRSLALRPAWSLSHPRRPVTPKYFGRSRYLLQPLRLLPAGATDAGRGSHSLRDGAFPLRTE